MTCKQSCPRGETLRIIINSLLSEFCCYVIKIKVYQLKLTVLHCEYSLGSDYYNLWDLRHHRCIFISVQMNKIMDAVSVGQLNKKRRGSWRFIWLMTWIFT